MSDDLHRQLIKLADILETCDEGDADHKYYSREYKNITKLLYPEMFLNKLRKPSNRFIHTLTMLLCIVRIINRKTK